MITFIRNWAIEYVYQPKEEQTSEHPGFEEAVMVEKVTFNGNDITEYVNIEKIEEEVLLEEQENRSK